MMTKNERGNESVDEGEVGQSFLELEMDQWDQRAEMSLELGAAWFQDEETLELDRIEIEKEGEWELETKRRWNEQSS